MLQGVSVIVCCYNSDWIIERCLKSLINQRVSHEWGYEIIVVNNASTDRTVEIARSVLETSDVNYKIVDEPKPGLLNARKKGISMAQYTYTVYCDDDNLLCETYISFMYDKMSRDRTIGACGATGIPEFEINPPQIILRHLEGYAVGKQIPKGSSLFGAGLCVQTEVVWKIYQQQPFYLTGRCNGKLLAGDDGELVRSILLRGYKTDAVNSISYVHVLRSNRLTPKYLQKMVKGFALSSPVILMYDRVLDGRKPELLKAYLGNIVNFLFCCIKFYQQDYYFHFRYGLDKVFAFHYWGWTKLNEIHSLLLECRRSLL